ncbi:MAG: putative DNA-binding domain-containing protein [Planctomycetes bacterium]|nr:putative DNA-binding domain-containing protein [Planctomycetota bacterium]
MLTAAARPAASSPRCRSRRLVHTLAAPVRQRILPSATLAPEERLEIYAQMMRERFVASLERDFPATCVFLGAQQFRELALAYANTTPSRHYNLIRYGDRFARFIKGRAGEHAAPASDLAHFEWALSESFDAPEAPPLDVEALAKVPASRAGGHCLALAPAVRLLELNDSIIEIYRACVEGRRRVRTRRRSTCVLVYRTGFQVQFREIDGAQMRALKALRGRGVPLARAVRLAALGFAGTPVARLRWLRERFAEWTSLGLLATAGRPPAASRILPTAAR